MTRPGECCPSSWECGAWQRRLEAPGQCWHQGRLYSPGEDIPAVSERSGCRQACQCSTNTRGLAEIICAVRGGRGEGEIISLLNSMAEAGDQDRDPFPNFIIKEAGLKGLDPGFIILWSLSSLL